MLTRVGVEHRVRQQLLVWMAATLVLTKVASMGALPYLYPRLVPLIVLLAFAVVTMGWVLNLRATLRLVEEAACRAGLQPH
jgi:hypothetical protein